MCNKYKGVAYWYYHVYFWDKVSEYREQGIDLDWSALDPKALHAALANNSSTNYCDLCQSWCNSTSPCSFNHKDGFGSQRQSNLGVEVVEKTSNRGKAYHRGKEICNKCNFS